jgi:hypothetical protein
MKYKVVENVDPLLWQRIVDSNPSATFYHTPAWGEILCETFPKWKDATIGIDYEDGNWAIFPMLRHPLIGALPFYWHESTVPGAYGGPIFQSSPSFEHTEVIEKILAGFNNLLIVSNPFFDWQCDKNFSRYETFIQILRLSPDFGKTWMNYSKGRRHTINYARKQGVAVREVSFFNNFQAYYKIYQRQLERWGKNATDYYPLRLFENLAVFAQTHSQIKLWAAFLEDKMISGLIVFYHNKHLVTWHGATLDEYFEYRPVDILYSTVIEEACNSGLEIFDFANSGGHQNVVNYKERFGAKKVPLTIYRRRNLLGIVYRLERHLKNYVGNCPED